MSETRTILQLVADLLAQPGAVSRRSFLRNTGVLAGSAISYSALARAVLDCAEAVGAQGAPTLSPSAGANALFATGSRYEMNTPRENQSASIIDLEGNLVAQWPVPENAHQVLQWSSDPDLIVSVPKEGRHLSAFRMSDPKWRADYVAPEGVRFSGHGVASRIPGGLALVVTASRTDPERLFEGRLIFLDPTAMRELGQAESGGHDPHEVMVANDQSSLLICNGGSRRSKPNVALFDTTKGQVRHVLESPLDPSQSLRHVAHDGRGGVLIGSLVQLINSNSLTASRQPTLVRLTLGARGMEWREVWPDPGWLKDRGAMNQFLSIAFDPFSQSFGSTTTRGDLVLIHDARRLKLRHEVSIPRPTGIAPWPNQSRFAVTTEGSGSFMIDPESGQATQIQPWRGVPFNGSHLSLLLRPT